MVRPVLPQRLIVLLDPLPEQTSQGLYLPTKQTTLAAGLPKAHALTAQVLAAGPQAQHLVGQRVAFTRLYYGWLYRLSGGRQVGFVDARNVLFTVGPEVDPRRIESVR